MEGVTQVETLVATLWGKARPNSEGASEPSWHRLDAHCLDVAAVALIYLNKFASPRRRAQLLAPFADHPSPELALALVVALHDLGKCSPAFQNYVPELTKPLRDAGFDFPSLPSPKRHDRLGAEAAFSESNSARQESSLDTSSRPTKSKGAA